MNRQPLATELWLVDLDRMAEALFEAERHTPRLAAGDEARAARLADRSEQRLRRAAYIAQRLVLERLVGTHLRTFEIPRDRGGRPVLPAEYGGAVSLAHTGHYALIGCTRDARIGVDIEVPRSLRMDARRQAIIVAGAQGVCPTPLPASDQARFLQAWTRLEALAKADGRGVGHVLTAIGASGAARGGHVSAAAEIGTRIGCRVHDVDVGDRLIGAVAVAGPVPALRRVPETWAELLQAGVS